LLFSDEADVEAGDASPPAVPPFRDDVPHNLSVVRPYDGVKSSFSDLHRSKRNTGRPDGRTGAVSALARTEPPAERVAGEAGHSRSARRAALNARKLLTDKHVSCCRVPVDA